MIREFSDHMAADVKQLVEDENTGAKSFRYVRTGTDHYSLAFTYDCIAWSREWCVAYARCWNPDEDYYDPILHNPF